MHIPDGSGLRRLALPSRVHTGRSGARATRCTLPHETRPLNLELLRTLVAVGTAATFSEAAASRGVSTPAISQQVKVLEAQLGVRLFEKIGRRAVLTQQGAALVEILRREFAVVDDAIAAVVDDARAIEGVVRLGGPAPFSAMWLRPKLLELARSYPRLRFHVEYGVPSLLVQRLRRGELDLCLVVSDVHDEAIATHVVHVEEFVPVASSAYLRENGRPESAVAFRDHPFIVYDDDLAMVSTWWRASFGRRERLPDKIRYSVTSLDDIRYLARNGIGIAVLPDYFVVDDIAAGVLERVCPHADVSKRKKQAARNPISLCWRRGAIETARLATVRGALLEKSLVL